MKTVRSKILVICCLLLLVGCSNPPDITLAPKITVYFSDDTNKQIELNKNDEAYKELDTWLVDNKSDWITTSGHFPSGMYVVSGNYGIQITKLHVVLYLSNKKDTKASYIQNLAADELANLRGLK